MMLQIQFDFSYLNSQAWTIFIVGWLIVFSALVILQFIFRYMPNVVKVNSRVKKIAKSAKERNGRKQKNGKSNEPECYVSGQVTAAIAMALHQYYNELHDDEERVLTVIHKSRKYSPWNSKIYNVMDIHPKK